MAKQRHLEPGGCDFAAANTFADALNAAGDVCGYGYGPEPLAWPEGYWRAFYLPIDCGALGGTTTYQIPALSGVTRTDYSSAAYGVNKFGQTVGYTQKEDQNQRQHDQDFTGPLGQRTLERLRN